MPQGKTVEEILTASPWLWEQCSNLGLKMSTRLHILAFSDKRGV